MDSRVVVAVVVVLWLTAVPAATASPGGQWSDDRANARSSDVVATGAETAGPSAVGGPASDGTGSPGTTGDLTSGDRVRTDERGRRMTGDGTAPAGDGTGPGAVNVTYTIRLAPERPHHVEVTLTLRNTDDLGSLRAYPGRERTVVRADGFNGSDGVYEWTGTEGATLVYRWNLSASDQGVGGESWAMLENVGISFGWDGTPLEKHRRIAGEGYMTETTVLLGDHDVYRREVDGRTLSVVVPNVTDTPYDPATALDAVAAAARSLDVGSDDESVTAFWAPRFPTGHLIANGLTVGDRTFYVGEDAGPKVWIHEYVHTAQEFRGNESMEWFTEAVATYYEHVLAVKHGYGDWGTFTYGLLLQTDGDDSVLSRPDTWGTQSDYHKGGVVLAVVDRRIRNATDGKRTLEDVFRRLNDRTGAVTVEGFVAVVREVGGDRAAEAARTYATTTAVPPSEWTKSEFTAVYGFDPASVSVFVESATAVSDHGSRRLDEDADTVLVAVGETLRLTLAAHNTGGIDGWSRVATDVSSASEPARGPPVDTWITWVAAGGSANKTVSYRFDDPGTYTVWVEQTGAFDVRAVPERGTATVESVTAVEGTDATGTVTFRVAVTNEGDRATAATLPVTLDGERVDDRTVVLEAGETTTLTVEVTVSDRGEHTVGVGDASTTVRVGATTTTDDGTTTASDGTTPGTGTTTEVGTPTDATTPRSTTAGATAGGGTSPDGTGSGTSTAPTDGSSTGSGTPGFGGIVAVATIALVLLALRRR